MQLSISVHALKGEDMYVLVWTETNELVSTQIYLSYDGAVLAASKMIDTLTQGEGGNLYV